MEYQTVKHSFEPLFDDRSLILILGSLPSVKSRENDFYYGHPKNRFWSLMAGLLKCDEPLTKEEKKEMLLSHNSALWDVIAQCDIRGSSDSSIRNVIPNDINIIVNNSCVRTIFANGGKTEELYNKYCSGTVRMPIFRLPSTSPANASCGMDSLKEKWQCVTVDLSNAEKRYGHFD